MFLTWRLYGSLPRSVDLIGAKTDGQRFVLLDRQLDSAVIGPTWLKDERIAQCVVESLLKAEKEWGLYDLHAWVIMSNHVHVLLTPHKPLRQVTQAAKSTSARGANLILGRSGERFWQAESYDHWVRDIREFDRIVRYIEENPVSAGLVGSAEEWAWSSANARFQA
jgi:putative transposase